MNSMAALQHYPEWRPTRSNKPLAVSLLLSTAIIALILSVIQVPRWDLLTGANSVTMELEIIDRTNQNIPASKPLPAQVAEEFTDEQSIDEPPVDSSADNARSDESVPDVSVEWYSVLDVVVDNISSETSKPPSLSPGLDELRQVAKIRYAPVADFGPKPVWDNVEKDQMGRTILRFGDCYRVLEDWRVTNRWAQENFGQYFVYCESHEKIPKELPFVAQIVERYDYLRE
jgi:hypothetical protein